MPLRGTLLTQTRSHATRAALSLAGDRLLEMIALLMALYVCMYVFVCVCMFV